ncbi:MAG: CAP domain-containing protein, partial [Dehalococcoidia bacterium]
PVPPAPPASGGLDTSPMDGFEQALFGATNARRAASGLAPLSVNGYLVGIARLRSDEMATYNYFAHESPITGHSAFSLMDQYGVPYGWAGENLAKNNYPNDQTVAVADEALWNSPSHRANILNAHYTDVGIALTIDATGMKYFTIVFTGH